MELTSYKSSVMNYEVWYLNILISLKSHFSKQVEYISNYKLIYFF